MSHDLYNHSVIFPFTIWNDCKHMFYAIGPVCSDMYGQ